jgi:hypothetical protein
LTSGSPKLIHISTAELSALLLVQSGAGVTGLSQPAFSREGEPWVAAVLPYAPAEK